MPPTPSDSDESTSSNAVPDEVRKIRLQVILLLSKHGGELPVSELRSAVEYDHIFLEDVLDGFAEAEMIERATEEGKEVVRFRADGVIRDVNEPWFEFDVDEPG